MVEWTTGMDWDKIFALTCNLKRYMDQVDRYCMTNYASWNSLSHWADYYILQSLID